MTQLIPAVEARGRGWLRATLAALRTAGVVVMHDVVSRSLVEQLTVASYRVREAIEREVGSERLDRAGEIGVLRLPMKSDPTFLRLFELPEILAVIDATVGPTAICHVQNGLILPPGVSQEEQSTFQHRWHRDFPRYLNGYVASLNTLVCLSEFTATGGGTAFALGSHQRPGQAPNADDEESIGVAEASPGSIVMFDSTIWHRAGFNCSGTDRLAINHQWTCSWIKQQIDYVRALGDEQLAGFPDRTRQLLGWQTRVVTSLDEYYQPPERRLYQPGQG